MIDKAELSEGQKQLVRPTISGTRKAEARRAEVEDRLLFRGGINGGPNGDGARTGGNGNAGNAGTNQPLRAGTRGTIVNITA